MHKVFVYHTISAPRVPLPAHIDVSADKFESHLEWLKQRAERVVDLYKILESAPDRELFAITFDDGFRDNLTVALPLLEKYNLPMTLFAVADFIGTENYLSREELKTLAAHPLVTIGSHGLRHRHFSRMTEPEARFELLESKRKLEEITGKQIDLLAYPYGDCDIFTEKLAEECGYRAAWSVWNGANSQYARWRVPLGRNDHLLRFIAKASKVYFPVKKIIKPPLEIRR